jgi:xanthine dehydrogenase small subunit
VEVRDASPRTLLLDYLRLEERSTGTKEGCGERGIAAPARWRSAAPARRRAVVYEPVNACILLLGQVDGADLVTVEDLAADGSAPSGPGRHGGSSTARSAASARRASS